MGLVIKDLKSYRILNGFRKKFGKERSGKKDNRWSHHDVVALGFAILLAPPTIFGL